MIDSQQYSSIKQHVNRPNISAGVLALALFIYLIDALPLANFIALLGLNMALYGLRTYCTALNTHHHSPLRSNWLQTAGKAMLWVTCLLLGFFIALYRPDDFHYPQVYSFYELNFQLFANWGKAIAGLLIIVWLWPASSNVKPSTQSAALALLAVLIVIVSANMMGLAWQFKLPEGLLWFLLINVVFTVIAEEAFFRLLIQETLQSLGGNTRAAMSGAAIFSVAVFTFAHVSPTHQYFLLFLLAGSLYAAVYTYSRRFYMAALTHAGVNIGHFILLPYPLPV